MSDLVVYPSSYDSTNHSYDSVNSSYPLSNVVGKSSSNTTYAQWNLKRGSHAETYVFYLFDLSEIPSNATIDSVSCTAKAYISNTSIFRISSRTIQMYCGTNTPKGSASTVSSSESEITLDCGSWTREELNDCRIRIYAKRESFSTSSSIYNRFYGATLTVTYTINGNTYIVTSSASDGGSITPSGTIEVLEGESLNFTMNPDDGYILKSLTIDGNSVSTIENQSSALENGISLLHCEDLTDSLNVCTITNNGVSISTDVTKFSGGSLYFDQSSYLKLDLNSNDAYTIEFWAYIVGSNTSGWYPTLFSSDSLSNSGGTYMHIDDGGYSTYPVYRSNAASSSAGNNGGYGSTVITRNTWHHIALCVSGSSHYFFLDGELQYTVTQSSRNDYSIWYIGGLRGSSGMVSDCYFNGYIDEILISSICKWTSDFTVPIQKYSSESTVYYTYTYNNITSNSTVYALFGAKEVKIPIITIGTPTKSKISDESGWDECLCTFTSDVDLSQWEARATFGGVTPAQGVGLLVESGSSLSANTEATISVLDTELTSGEGEYTISIYGKSTDGVWSA